MKNIYIVGGNGFARECYYNILRMRKTDLSIQFAGFLGHGGYGHTVDYIDLQRYYKGEVSDHTFKADEYVVIGAGYPDLREKIYKELKARADVKFFTIYVGERPQNSVHLGEANIVTPIVYMSCNIDIGNGNVFNGDVIVGHDVKIGDFNFFGPRSQILGNVSVGNQNQIGANSILLAHSKIGNNNKIAPLSAVYKGCKNNCYLLGNPALKVGDVGNEQ